MSDDMEIRLIIVDKIPNNCALCDFCEWLGEKNKDGEIEDHYYCYFIDDELENDIYTSRNKKCPLETFDGLPFVDTVNFKWINGKLVKVYD